MGFDQVGLARLMRRQDGVAARQQLIDLGATRNDIRRMLSRRELAVVHPGVYVNHTGRPTMSQRQWAAVLALAPAALHRETALESAGLTRDRSPDGSPVGSWVVRRPRGSRPAGRRGSRHGLRPRRR